jgi:hypothetical protein
MTVWVLARSDVRFVRQRLRFFPVDREGEE